MFKLECPLECGKVLESEGVEGILRVYDRHRESEHPASPSKWLEAHKRIESGKESAKRKEKAVPDVKSR